MTSQLKKKPSQPLEERVIALETELAQVKQLLSELLPNKNLWWLKVAGSCEEDPNFAEAVRFGQEWRKSAE